MGRRCGSTHGGHGRTGSGLPGSGAGLRPTGGGKFLRLGLVALQRCIQDIRIAGEILQHIQRTGKAKNAHSLPRLVLLLDKTEHLAPRVTLVGIGSVEGIEQHGGHRSTGRTVLRAVRIDAWGQGLPSSGVFSGRCEG